MFSCVCLYTYASAMVCQEINKDGEMYITASIVIQGRNNMSLSSFHVGLNIYIRAKTCANVLSMLYACFQL